MSNNIHSFNTLVSILAVNLMTASAPTVAYSSNVKVGSPQLSSLSSNFIPNAGEFNTIGESVSFVDTSGLVVNNVSEPKMSYKERYKKISSSRSFQRAYANKSIGDIIEIDS
jgi:hypothetical protein